MKREAGSVLTPFSAHRTCDSCIVFMFKFSLLQVRDRERGFYLKLTFFYSFFSPCTAQLNLMTQALV